MKNYFETVIKMSVRKRESEIPLEQSEAKKAKTVAKQLIACSSLKEENECKNQETICEWSDNTCMDAFVQDAGGTFRRPRKGELYGKESWVVTLPATCRNGFQISVLKTKLPSEGKLISEHEAESRIMKNTSDFVKILEVSKVPDETRIINIVRFIKLPKTSINMIYHTINQLKDTMQMYSDTNQVSLVVEKKNNETDDDPQIKIQLMPNNTLDSYILQNGKITDQEGNTAVAHVIVELKDLSP